MADDNKPFDMQSKPPTIDDLVKQLSNNSPNQSTNKPLSEKSMTSQEPPSNLPGIRLDTKPAQQPSISRPSLNPIQPPQTQIRPQPSQIGSQPPRPPQPPVSLPTSPILKPSPVQEYKSSIRTMNDDIASIKSGQKPFGVDIPRKVTPDLTRPTTSEVPRPQAPSQPSITPGSTIGLGKADKTGPLPTAPSLKKPIEAPKPITVQPPPITVPTKKGRWLSALGNRMYLIIAGILVLGGVIYWFFMIRVPEPEVILSPTPTFTQTVTPTPIIRNLNEIFGGTAVIFDIGSSNKATADDFKALVNSLNIARNEFIKIDLVNYVNDTAVPLNWLEMFDAGQAAYPIELKDNMTDSLVVAYGQSESFNQDGSIDFSSSQGLNKVSFIAKVKDKAGTDLIMKNWEPTISNALSGHFSIGSSSKEASVNFLDNSYRSALIRYKNFPFPDTTIDYSVFESAGQTYLIISGSRESIYSVVDAILEQ